jgi:hypothetical protein
VPDPELTQEFIADSSLSAIMKPERLRMGCSGLFSGNQRDRKIMDPITASLAAKVVSVLAPYVVVGAEEFVRNAGKDAYEKAKTMFAALRAKWTGDEEATDALTRFEDKPERYAPVLEDVLREKLAEDKELATVLSTLLNEMGPSLEVVQKMEEGRKVTGLEADEMTGGRATVDQDIGTGEDVTGARIRRIGPQR